MSLDMNDAAQTFLFEVPGDPVAFARAGRNGKVSFTPKIQANYMNLVKVVAQEAMEKYKLDVLDGPLYVNLTFYYTMPKTISEKIRKKKITHTFKTSRPDVDNLSKIVLDACNTIVWGDDAFIAVLNIQKMYSEKAGFTRVIVSRL